MSSEEKTLTNKDSAPSLEQKVVASRSKMNIDKNGFISMNLNSKEARDEIRKQLSKLKGFDV
ncbi:hypothetical protein BCT90_11865 [Vibrio lentus]|uniref:hypothetical protein n=1 Tax=Vibrio lentus TaxID=136468 RepID=UPI000C84A0A3|nr:hypothetical protein [Vibrio lentus]PMI05262.1 hypothetical protein BCU53_14130 [Vibrio lentus]PMK83272.1 hypothetical protein BCT90_11865 [Vibrio lentus]